MVSSCLFDDSLLRLCCPDQGIGFEWVLGVVQWMVCAVTLKLITHFIYFIIKGCKKPNPCTSGKQDFSCTLGVIRCLNINGQLLASNIWLLSSIFGKGKQIICVVVAAQMWEKSLKYIISTEKLQDLRAEILKLYIFIIRIPGFLQIKWVHLDCSFGWMKEKITKTWLQLLWKWELWHGDVDYWWRLLLSTQLSSHNVTSL